MVIVLVLFVVFAIWFAVSKIKLREKLGPVALLLGCTELLVGAIHLTMLAVGLGILLFTVANNPEIDEAAMDKLFDSKAQLAIVISGVSTCGVSVVTMFFFAALRARSDDMALSRR